MIQQQGKKYDQRCKEAEQTLMQINDEITLKEVELDKYGKILGEAKSEKESFKHTKSDLSKIKKDVGY